MRAIGITLMGVGIFFVSVAAAVGLGPGPRALGIDVRAEATSVNGTALIGVLAQATGTFLRRRATESALQGRARDAVAAAATPGQLGVGAAGPLEVGRRGRVEERIEGNRLR
jgi:hypothetical protein